MHSTVATAGFWTAWKIAIKCLWARYRPISTVGRKSHTCDEKPPNQAPDDAKHTPAWPVGLRPAKSRIW